MSGKPLTVVDGTRYHGMDGLRAWMMLLGLVIHAIVSYMDPPGGEGWPFQDRSTSPVWAHLVFFIHTFRMPIFYVMAGFFAALLLTRRGEWEMFRNRTLRITFPFIIGWAVLAPTITSGFVFARGMEDGSWVEAWGAVRAMSIWGELYADSTHHLWFLYFLLIFYPVAIVLRWMVLLVPSGQRHLMVRAFDAVTTGRLRALWYAVPTFGLLWLQPLGLLRTSTAFVPDPVILVTYFWFFGFGWVLYTRRHLLPTFDRHAWLAVVVALVLAPVNSFSVMWNIERGGENGTLTLVAAATGALIVWLLTFGLTGLFQRYQNRPSPTVRYVVDASYWVYLVHLPFCIWIPGMLAPLAWASGLKIAVLLALAVPVWVLSYDVLVRSTVIGVALNGRRYPRGLPRLDHRGAPMGVAQGGGAA